MLSAKPPVYDFVSDDNIRHRVWVIDDAVKSQGDERGI